MRALKRCLGVDLGTSAVKITELAIDGGTIKVVRVAQAETGIDPMMSPEERKSALLKTARDLVKRSKFSTKNAVFGISGLKVFIRRFRLPVTSDERLERIVQFEARQQIPFPIDKTDLQFQYFPVEGTNEVDVILVAVRIDEIRDYMTVVDKVGLTPLSLGVSSFALFNAHSIMRLPREKLAAKLITKKPGKAKKGAEAEEAPAEEDFVYEEVKGYVNIGAGSYDIAIARNGKSSMLGFTRTPPIGGNDFSKAIMEHCGVSSFNDAESIKRSATRLMAFDFGFEESDQINEQACMAVTDAADRIVSELRRSLDYYISQPDGMAVDAIEITGGQALIPGIETFIEEKLTVPCTLVKAPTEDSGILWQESFGPITPYMVSLGLGMQGLGLSTVTVDFLPREKKIIRDFPYKSVAFMSLLVLASVGVSARVGIQKASQYQTRAQELQIQMMNVSRELKESTEARELNNAEAARIALVGKAFGQRDYWLKFLAKIAEVKPVDILLDGIDMQHDGSVLIIGVSEREGSPADFVRDLVTTFGTASKRPELIDIKGPTKDARYGGANVFSFRITLNPGDKINHLEVTPTPGENATPAGGRAPAGSRVRGSRGGR